MPSLAGTVRPFDGSTAQGMVLLDQAKASLTRGPSAEVRRVTLLSARYGDAFSSSSAPRKPTVNQSTTTASKPPARLAYRELTQGERITFTSCWVAV